MSELPEKINDIYERYKDVDFKQEIKNDLRTINDYASALDDGALLVAIIGDVKAGKSTFCNLLADKQICQTADMECTARPMLITVGDNIYRTYKKASGISEDKSILFEKILSNIIRNNSDADIKGVEIKSTEITSSSQADSNRKGEYVLISFSVNESDFVKDRIVFADLPGLDGSKFNFDVYQESILSRADYIIFVLNSTSDITDKDTEVFNYIYDNNKNTMVSVLVNLIDSTSFSPDDKSRENAEIKLKNTLDKPLFSKFSNKRSDLSVVVNLAMVKGYRMKNFYPDRKADVEREVEIFHRYAQDFMENVISKSEDIRKPNIESNICSRIEKLTKKIEQIIEDYEKTINKYNKINDDTRNVSSLVATHINKTDNRNWGIEIDGLLEEKIPIKRSTIEYETLEDSVTKYIDELYNSVIKLFQGKITEVCNFLNGDTITSVKALNSDLRDETQSLNLKTTVIPKVFSIAKDNEFTKEVKELFPKVSELLEKPRWYKRWFRWLPKVMKYSPDEFLDIIEMTREEILGVKGDKSQLIEQLEKKFNLFIENEISSYKQKLFEDINQNVQDQCQKKLTSIIPDYTNFYSIKDDLVELKIALENVECV